MAEIGARNGSVSGSPRTEAQRGFDFPEKNLWVRPEVECLQIDDLGQTKWVCLLEVLVVLF